MNKDSEVKITKNDYLTISKIVDRTYSEIPFIPPTARLSLLMDLENAHNQIPLDLTGLLNSNKSDFIHDVSGITHNMNRKTGLIENCFIPRYALPE
jgi:hypothetical protein